MPFKNLFCFPYRNRREEAIKARKEILRQKIEHIHLDDNQRSSVLKDETSRRRMTKSELSLSDLCKNYIYLDNEAGKQAVDEDFICGVQGLVDLQYMQSLRPYTTSAGSSLASMTRSHPESVYSNFSSRTSSPFEPPGLSHRKNQNKSNRTKSLFISIPKIRQLSISKPQPLNSRENIRSSRGIKTYLARNSIHVIPNQNR